MGLPVERASEAWAVTGPLKIMTPTEFERTYKYKRGWPEVIFFSVCNIVFIAYCVGLLIQVYQKIGGLEFNPLSQAFWGY
jgi:hypothetical protein